MGFDTRAYWENRLAGRFSLGGVGWLGLGEAFNSWAYRARRSVFLHEVKPLLPADQLVVGDIGSGTGFYIERWQELHAASISGFDLTNVAVENLRVSFPSVSFAQLDVSSELESSDEYTLAERFNAISAMDVLFHITRDEAYERALANLSSWLKPGGILIMSDFYVKSYVEPGKHVVYRVRSLTDRAARQAGLERILCRPLLVLLNDPVDTSNRAHLLLWRILVALLHGRSWLGHLVGAVLFPLEILLSRFTSYMPSTKLLVYRRAR